MHNKHSKSQRLRPFLQHIILLTVVFAVCSTPSFAADREKGFKTLFDGVSLSGWTGAVENYGIKNGILSSKKGVYGGLYSEQEFSNFELRFEFRLTAGANNGIALRAPLEGDPAYFGFESQMLDDSAEMYASLLPYQFHGSIYGIGPAKRGSLRPVGEWNEQAIVCDGKEISVVLNCETIVDIDLDQVAPEGKTIDGKEHPGLTRTAGHIGLMSHDDIVDFRNIRIREIESSKKNAKESNE